MLYIIKVPGGYVISEAAKDRVVFRLLGGQLALGYSARPYVFFTKQDAEAWVRARGMDDGHVYSRDP